MMNAKTSGKKVPAKTVAAKGSKPTAHPGFAAVQAKIAKRQGASKQAAGAILAAATRKASPAAKRKNPALRRVRGE